MNTKSKLHRVQRNFQFRVVFALLEYLFRAGVTEKDLRALTSRAFIELKRNARSTKKSGNVGSTEAAKLATAIQRWYRDRSLVDTDGKPIALHLFGRAPSVESLIKRERIGLDTKRFTKDLVKFKLVRRCRSGKYLPTGRHLIVRNHHPFLAEHHARSVIHLLNTARSNVSASSQLDFLIERCADVPRLPRGKLKAFRDFTNQQGEAFIDTVNDWLETHNVARGSKAKLKAKEAGVHVFAFYGGSR